MRNTWLLLGMLSGLVLGVSVTFVCTAMYARLTHAKRPTSVPRADSENQPTELSSDQMGS